MLSSQYRFPSFCFLTYGPLMSMLWSSNFCILHQPAYQVHLLLEYGPKNMMFLVLWMIVRPSFSSELMAKK